MKKIIFTVFIGLMLSACTTIQMFKPTDLTQDGIRYQYGSSKGMKVGDKIIAYKQRTATRKGKGYTYDRLGTLTVLKVEEDKSFLKKDSEFEIGEDTAFFRD